MATSQEKTKAELIEELATANEKLVAMESFYKELADSVENKVKPTVSFLSDNYDRLAFTMNCMAVIRDRMTGSFLSDEEFRFVSKTFVKQAIELAKMIEEELKNENSCGNSEQTS